MSDTPHERNSTSKTNLIEVQHVGVTAKLQSPLKNLLQSSLSSTETENGQLLFHDHHRGHKMKYNKFSNDSQAETETCNEHTSKLLYEMRAVREASTRHAGKRVPTPSKIEFQLYKTPTRRARRSKSTPASTMKCSHKKSKRKLFAEQKSANKNANNYCPCHHASPHRGGNSDNTILKRLRHSLENMRAARPRMTKPKAPKCNDIFDELPEQCAQAQQQAEDNKELPQREKTPPPTRETRIGIYPFEHGCAEYLRTTDCQPQLLSVILAERATYYATRFWAEFFGSLHIGVTFVVTFLLQAYRFVLFSLVNTLVVGFLHMTSDYLIKPMLTVFFNGFLQPPLILIYNILTSIRDILEPIAETINNFMRPVATVGRSLRLVHVNVNKRKLVKEV